MIRLLLLYVVIPAVGACSSTPRLNLIHDGDAVAILSPADVESGKTDLDINNQAIGQGAKTGAEAGAITGAAYGLFCGPLFWLCSPFLAGAGAVVGAATGAAVGTTQGLSSDEADQATLKITEYLQKHDPQDAFLTMLVGRAEKRWDVRPPPVARELIVQLDAVQLNKKRAGPVVLFLRATVTIRFADKTGKQQNLTREFEYEGPETYVDSWTEDSDDFLNLRFSDAYQTLAENIVVALSRN